MSTRNRVTWCMKANTYTSLRLTISPCARIAPNCASRGDLTATLSVSDTFWRTRLPPSSNVNMWPSITANAAPTPSPNLRTVGEFLLPICKAGSGWDMGMSFLFRCCLVSGWQETSLSGLNSRIFLWGFVLRSANVILFCSRIQVLRKGAVNYSQFSGEFIAFLKFTINCGSSLLHIPAVLINLLCHSQYMLLKDLLVWPAVQKHTSICFSRTNSWKCIPSRLREQWHIGMNLELQFSVCDLVLICSVVLLEWNKYYLIIDEPAGKVLSNHFLLCFSSSCPSSCTNEDICPRCPGIKCLARDSTWSCWRAGNSNQISWTAAYTVTTRTFFLTL